MKQAWKRILPGTLALLAPVLVWAKEQTTVRKSGSATEPTSAVSQRSQPVLMLVGHWEKGMDVRGWWASEKFDGIRAFWDGTELLTRRGNPIAAPEWFTAGLPEWPLDGELWVGQQQFAKTLSIVRDAVPGAGWVQVRFLVFDAPQAPGNFEQRQAFLKQWTPPEHVRIVTHERVADEAALQARLARIEQEGGEGLVLRRPGSLYAPGRSGDWLKVKSYDEGDAVVIGHLPGKGKHTGRLGALQVRLADEREFRIGTGFSDAEREAPPLLGSTITFRHSGFTKTGLPRFAVFLHIREDF